MRCLVCGHSAAEHGRRIYARKYGYRSSVACDRCECVRLEGADDGD